MIGSLTTTDTNRLLAALLSGDCPPGVFADHLKDRDLWTWPVVLRHVLERPDADPPRELAALWYEEAGQPERAAFIRVQCELAGPRAPDDLCHHDLTMPDYCPRCRLRRRERGLLEAHGHRWFKVNGLATYSSKVGGPFEGWCLKRSGEGGTDLPAVVSRGFVAEVTLPTAAFLAHAGALFRAQPVTGVTLSDKRPDGGFWWWRDGDGTYAANRAYLPSVLFNLLPDRPNVLGMNGSHYDSEDLALAALSAAAVTEGRRLAGLPALDGGT